VKNVGHTEALFVKLPSRPYDHADPDKYRVPIDGATVPYQLWRHLQLEQRPQARGEICPVARPTRLSR
jgi:hypothetical protein